MTMTTKMDMILYSSFRKVIAPLCMLFINSFILLLPGDLEETKYARYAATRIATTPATSGITPTQSMRLGMQKEYLNIEEI